MGAVDRRRTISCCMTAGGDAARVRAILDVVRPHVDEIVLAADARRGEEILGACGDLVDRALRYEFAAPPARYIGWIHHQCGGDWILRLDDDEVPGTELLAGLPELAGDRRCTRIALPRRHLVGTPDRYLVSHPWHPDYQVRLLQNLPGLWSFAGTVHHAAEVLGEQRRVPAPIYHLNYVLAPLEERRAKALRFESLNPGAMTEAYPVNALYLPEEWDGIETAAVPDADRPLIARAFSPAPAPAAAQPAALPPLTPVEQVDRYNRARPVSPGAYAAGITLVDPRRRLAAGTLSYLEVLIRNDGDERWPPAHHAEPDIRLAYRWLDARADDIVAEGLRTPFEETVVPGAHTRVMMAVQPPDEPGVYVLEIDIVHEWVRWFECQARVTMAVERVSDPPAARQPEAIGPALPRPRDVAMIQSTGLDGLDLRLLEHLPDRSGTFVEAGAHDGVTQSNTLLLERTRGWRGLLVEPVPEQAERCRANRPRATVEQCALVASAQPGETVRVHFSGLMSVVAGAMGSAEADAAHVQDGLRRQSLGSSYTVEVPAATLSGLLDAHGMREVDLLVLDVEGAEAAALGGLDLDRHRPVHLLIEARFRAEVEAILGDVYEAVAELSHHDVLYRRRSAPPRRLAVRAKRLLGRAGE